MALNPDTNVTMAGRITAADADYPYGSSQNETSPGAGDGTPYFKGRADDIFGFQQWLLTVAGIVPTGTADNANASQYGEALRSIFGNVGLTVMTASGTYNPPDNAKALLVIATGGGGGSGGVEAQTTGESTASGGGGGGGSALSLIDADSIQASYAVTVGAAGAAGANTPSAGGTGGATTFEGGPTSISVSGGEGGRAGLASSTGGAVGRGGTGGLSTGDSHLSIEGGPGGDGIVFDGAPMDAGAGGGTLLAPAAHKRSQTQTTGRFPGGVGAGLGRFPGVGSGAPGASGAAGAVTIVEFYQL